MALIIIAFIGWLIFFVVLNFLVSKIIWLKKNKRIAEIKKAISISKSGQYKFMNVGSTQAIYAFNYSDSGVNGINLALSPQLFDNDNDMINHYAHLLNKNAIIFLPICPLSMLCDRFTIPSNRYKYYHLLSKENISFYNKREYIQEIRFPLFFRPVDSIKELLKYILGRLNYPEYLLQSSEQMELDAQQWVDGWNNEFFVNIEENIVKTELADRITNTKHQLEQLIIRASQFGKPVVVLMPISRYLAEKLHPEFINKYLYTPLNEILSDKIMLLDYMDDRQFLDDSLFANSFFLNKEGSALFTERIINDLKRLKYEN